jgi:hypothetical protein
MSGGGNADAPVPLNLKLDLGTMTSNTSNWQKTLSALVAAGKYVDLDLSRCAIQNGTEFDPVSSVATGKNKIVTIALPDTATSIVGGSDDQSVFGNFENLKSFSGTGLTTIGNFAFFDCTNLALTSLPAGITEIGDGAFYDCTNLTTITLPDGLQNIGDGAFYGCTSLTGISLPATVSISGNGVFMLCTSLGRFEVRGSGLLSTVESGKALVQNGELLSYPTAAGIITLPAGLTKIGTSAFRYCNGLTTITLPASLSEIVNGAFENCTNLATVTCLATLLPTLTLGNTVFSSTHADLKIYVPADCVDAYKSGWSNYKDIIFPIGGTEIINITFEQIKDIADITGGTIYRTGGENRPTSLTLNAPTGYTNYVWTIDGVGANPSPITLSTNYTATVSANNVNYNSVGNHPVYLFVTIDGVSYNKTIMVRIVE